MSGRSAAILHGLPTIEVPELVELGAAAAISAGRHGNALVRRSPGSLQHTTMWAGVATTDAAHTVVGLAARDRRDGIVAVDAALREHVCSRRQLDDALAHRSGSPGARQAREIVGLGDLRAESPLESLLRLALHDDGFPPPQLQVWIGTDRTDLLSDEQRLVLEADGREKYVGDALWSEKIRERRLRRRGYRVVPVFWSDVMYDWPAMSAHLRQELANPPARPSLPR